MEPEREGQREKCKACRDLGVVTGFTGEVLPCLEEMCVRKRAVELLGSAAGAEEKTIGSFDFGGVFKNNTEFRRLAFAVAVVGELAKDVIEKARKNEKIKLYDPIAEAAIDPSRRKKGRGR